MTLLLNRIPRGDIVVRVNECLNPSFETDINLWETSNYGVGGAGNVTRKTDGGRNGSARMRKILTTAATDCNDFGHIYRHNGWSGNGTQKTASAYLYSSNQAVWARVSIYSFDSNNNVISRQDGAPAYLSPNTWTRVSGTFSTPNNTAYSKAAFWLVGGSAPYAASLPVNYFLDIDSCQIEPGSTLSDYIDGDLWASGNGDQRTVWAGTANSSQSILYRYDPATAFNPDMVLGYDVSQQGRNVVHQLIDGPVVASLLSASTRSGVLKLFFATADAAENARRTHAGAGYWQYTDSDWPSEAMSYVVNGAVRKYQTDDRLRWILEVPYQELS